MSKVDSSLTRNDTTQAQLTRHTELIKFMKTHCHERAYSFQVQNFLKLYKTISIFSTK